MKYTILSLLLCYSLFGYSQEYTEGHISKQIDYAVDLMNRGEYKAADAEFRSAMGKLDVLPSNVAYYFGRNSYHLEKYKQSINWLNKYIQLKGTKGRFYSEAVKYLQFAEEEYLIISRQEQAEMSEELSSGEYDCGGLSKMICPVCHGDGVILKKGPFDWIYKTCPYSAGESFLTCEDYNLFMRGLLNPKTEN
jgi:tetratricopeptide (TPR) repeat protein